jgi:hypothetical protein
MKLVSKMNTMPTGLRRVGLVACIAMLASCASKEKPKSDYGSLNFQQRLDRQMKVLKSGKSDDIKSPFQQEVYNASRTVKTSEFNSGKGAFRSKKKGFFGSKEKFKAGTFAQSDKSSRVGNQVFSGADNESRYGNSTFRTSQNRFSDKMSPSAAKTSNMSDDVFSTAGNPAALKNTTTPKTPLIDREASYSEFEVRKLLNKG